MQATDILVTGTLMDAVMDQLESAFIVHRLPHEEANAFIAEIGPRIRGVATGGHLKVDESFMGRFPKLEIVSNFGVGYEAVDAAWAGRHGIVVTNTPDVLTEEVADTALGLLLMTVRNLSQAERYLRAGHWEGRGPFPLSPSSLRGRTIGILALGRIGKAIARRCEAFGLTIAYHGRNPQCDVPYRYYADLVEMAKDVDILVSVAPGGAATHHMINAEVLRALGPEGILINVGRGTVVDEAALIEALRQGTIRSAGLDVFEIEPHVPPELVAMDHVVLLPHVGSASAHTRRQMGQLVVDNLKSWFAGKGPLTPVAETPWPR